MGHAMFTTVYVTIITLYSNNEYLLKLAKNEMHDLQFAANICCSPWHTEHRLQWTKACNPFLPLSGLVTEMLEAADWW